MASKDWKERITLKRNIELQKRGVKLPKNEEERKEFLKATEARGGMFVPEIKEEKSEDLDAVA